MIVNNGGMDQLTAMRVFVRIADSGGFAKAADSLNIPRPTVTKLVQDLESHLGAKLFQRTTRRVAVTVEGAAYYERATKLLAELEDMDAQFSGAGANPKGRLRVDIGSSLANLILIPQLPAFRRAYPDIQLELGVSDRHVDLVGDAVDCVIRGGQLSDTSLVARRLAELDYVTCATADYLKARGIPRSPEDLLEQHDTVGYFSSLTGRVFSMAFQRLGEQAVHEVDLRGAKGVAVNESTAHMTALLSGLGVGQTFRFMAQPHFENGSLVPVLTGWTRPRHPIHAVFPQNRHTSAKLRVFVDWAVAVFAPYDSRQ